MWRADGSCTKAITRAHEQVLIIIAQEEVIEGFKMSSLNHTKTLWQEPKWEDYNCQTHKGQSIKAGLYGVHWTFHYHGASHIIWQMKTSSKKKIIIILNRVNQSVHVYRTSFEHSVACLKIILFYFIPAQFFFQVSVFSILTFSVISYYYYYY